MNNIPVYTAMAKLSGEKIEKKKKYALTKKFSGDVTKGELFKVDKYLTDMFRSKLMIALYVNTN